MIRLDGTSVGGGTATIGGSIAATQIAYGSGANTIAGNAGLTFLSATSPGVFLGQKTPAMAGGGPWGSAWISGIAGSYASLNMETSDQTQAVIQVFGHGGTFAVPTGSSDGDTLLTIHADGAKPNGIQSRAGTIEIIVDGTPSNLGGVPGRIEFAVTQLSGGNKQIFTLTPTAILAKTDITLSDGKAIHPDSTDAHTMLFQVYDNDTGPGYVTWATVTNGNTPSVVIAPPAGGTTITIQATTYKSSDGTSGLASFSGAVSNITVKNGLITAAS